MLILNDQICEQFDQDAIWCRCLAGGDHEYNRAYLDAAETEFNSIANDCGVKFGDGEIPTNLVFKVLYTDNFALWDAFCRIYAWLKEHDKDASVLVTFIKETNNFDPVMWRFVADLR